MKDRIGRTAATLALMVLLGGAGCVKETEPPVVPVTSRPVELAETPEVTATTDRVITDFEDMDGWGFTGYPGEVDGYLTQSYDDEPSHDGDCAARLVYDFTKTGGVTAAAYAQTAHLLPLNWTASASGCTATGPGTGCGPSSWIRRGRSSSATWPPKSTGKTPGACAR